MEAHNYASCFMGSHLASIIMMHIISLDLAVGAPYELSSGSTSNTGAVYIYYGRDTKEEFNNQQPQRVSGYK